MMNIKKQFAIFSTLLSLNANAAAPLMDSFHVQSYLKLSNNSPVSATSGDFVFALFKGSTCLWAKRYAGVAINSGLINQSISGTGTLINSISNSSATVGECVADFTSTTINGTLINMGSAAALSIRIYAETTIDGFQPIWDVPLKTSPTALVADTATTATTATTANDLSTSKKASTSTGVSDAGKVVVLNGSGVIDSSMISSSSLTISNTQVTGLGTAATKNTGTASGNVPVLDGSGKLASSVLPTFTASKVIASDGSGAISGTYTTTTTSAGASDAGKIPVLNSSGLVDSTMVDTSGVVLNPANLTGAVSVAKGGTGVTSITTGSLIVGAGTSAITEVAPSTSGNILSSNGTAWLSRTPDTAGVVDKTNAQTVAGNKTWSGNQVVNGTMTLNSTFTLGTGGSAFTKVLNCTIASAALTSGTEKTGTCTGATTSSTVSCSPSVVPGTAWIMASVRASASNTIAVMPYRVTGSASWTTAFKCVVFVP